MVVTSGGAYVDAISKKSIDASQNNSLRAVVTPGETYVILSPLTTFATARAWTLIAEGKPIAASIDLSDTAVARQYNLESIIDTYPTDVTDTTDVETSTTESRDAGLIDAGIGQEASALGISDLQLTEELAVDLSDGNFDGKVGGSPIDISPSVPLPPNAGDAQLQSSIGTYAASPGNLTHLPAPQISTVTPNINFSAGGSFYVSSGSLPLWIDGQPGSATINGSGGTSPYRCELKSGPLPTGFSLSDTCVISGTGHLAGGAVESISAPFTIKMFDASSPAQSADVELKIDLVEVPPQITPGGGNCPDTVTPCSRIAATATGGTQPYHFGYGSLLNGTAPLGMLVHGDGTISGTPATEGSYTFEVCVVDNVGSSACTAVTITVGPNVTPQPSPDNTDSSQPASAPPANLPAGFPTDLPPGDYQMQFCVTVAGCFAGPPQTLTSDQYAGFAQAISDFANSNCSGTCNAQYSGFDGQSFTVTLTGTDCGTGKCVPYTATITVTKVG
jgi:Putative Ig domain